MDRRIMPITNFPESLIFLDIFFEKPLRLTLTLTFLYSYKVCHVPEFRKTVQLLYYKIKKAN